MNATNSSMGSTPEICLTPACIHAASEILYNLAPNYTAIDPCTDFDEYTCAGWVERNTADDGASSADVFGNLLEDTRGKLRKILESPYAGDSNDWISVNYTEEQTTVDVENFQKLQAVYATCLNYTEHTDDGLNPLIDFVATVAEAFPANVALNSSAGNGTYDHSAALNRTFVLFEGLGIETTQIITVRQDYENPDISMIAFNPPSKTDIPTTPEALLEYLQIASALLAAVHPANITIQRASSLLVASIQLQSKVAPALLAAAQEIAASQDPDSMTAGNLYPPKTSIDELQQLAPHLNYQAVIETFAPAGYNVSDMYIPGLVYYGNLSLIVSQTPPEVIQTFFVWKAISSMATSISSPLTDAYNDFITTQGGTNPNDGLPRWKKCMRLLDSGVDWVRTNQLLAQTLPITGLDLTLSRFFVGKHYSAEARDLAQELLDTLEESFIERMQNNTWATDEVKAAAVDKAKNIRNKIALPTSPNATDPVALQRRYADVDVNGTYPEIIISLAKSAVAYSWSTVDQPYDREKFIKTTLEPNAYYNPPLNEIVMLAGIQQFPLFDVDFPTYLTYGGMGSISGHEIIHGFDDRGRLFDARGNLTVWWDNSTVAAFKERSQCFVEQYGNYSVTAPNGTQVPVNGRTTLGENIADAGGIVNSYAAWKKVEKKMGRPAKNLPGLQNFTQEQLFFIKWGQMWCNDIAPELQVRLISSDPHAPNSARIAVAVNNSAEFRKAFDCPVKQPTCELY